MCYFQCVVTKGAWRHFPDAWFITSDGLGSPWNEISEAPWGIEALPNRAVFSSSNLPIRMMRPLDLQ